LAADGLAGSDTVTDNAANPTVLQILEDGPCDPTGTIPDLLAAGAINQGEAMALSHVADHSLQGLTRLLELLVEQGHLTPLEAQLLFAIASAG